MQKTNEIFFLNGSILTMNGKDRQWEAVAVCGNTLSFVGTTAEVRKRIGPRQGISVREAIRAYTIVSTSASFEEERKGSIAVGKLADLVVLSADVEKIPAEKIKDPTVDLLMVDGVIRYERAV